MGAFTAEQLRSRIADHKQGACLLFKAHAYRAAYKQAAMAKRRKRQLDSLEATAA